jgi:hypothetical protein
VAILKASGVRRIYGLPGDSLNGLTDALRRDGDITWQHVRHEEAAAFAAAGEAAGTGEPVAALLPGLREARDDEHLTRMIAHYRRTRGRLDALARTGDGDGPPHPASPRSTRTWRRPALAAAARALSTSRPVRRPSNAGHGRSPAISQPPRQRPERGRRRR